MKIGIPSADQTNIFPHFGRSTGFVKIEIDDKNILAKEFIDNTFTGHAQGQHQDHQENHEHLHNHAAHSHAGIFSALGDCEVIIANGMGRRLYDEFMQNGKKVFVTKETNVETAVTAFLRDSLDNNESSCCTH